MKLEKSNTAAINKHSHKLTYLVKIHGIHADASNDPLTSDNIDDGETMKRYV